MQTSYASTMPETNLQKLDSFLERWGQLRTAVLRIGPYARMIDQVEGALKEYFENKEKLHEATEELWKSKANEKKLDQSM